MSLSLEYIAGYIDADGTIVIVKTNGQGKHYYGKVCVYSQNRRVLEGIQETIGGKISVGSLIYNLQLSPKDTVNALGRLLPYLQVKREQAQLVLELHQHIERNRCRSHKGKIGGAFHSEEVWNYREELYLKNKELNKFDSLAFRTNRVNSVETQKWAIPSQAEGGEVDSSEGVTTSHLTPKNNGDQECPARVDEAKGRDSLAHTVLM